LTDETYDNIDILKQRLHTINERIREIEEKLSGDYKRNLQNQLEAKLKELTAHEAVKPVTIPDPQNEKQQKMIKTSRQKIIVKKQEITQKETDLEKAKELERSNTLVISNVDIALEKLINFKEQFKLFQVENRKIRHVLMRTDRATNTVMPRGVGWHCILRATTL
jgi:L-lactate utilization protein LutC